MIPVTPCKDCEARFLGCHSNCKDYVEWSKNRRETMYKYNKERYIENALVDHKMRFKEKMRRSKK